MSNSRGFAWLPVLIALVAVLGVSGGAYFYTHPEKMPTFDFSLAPLASSTPTQNVQPFIVTPTHGPLSLQRSIHPEKQDWIVIIADAPDMSVDLTGWTIRSAQSGKSFAIKPQGGTQDIRIGSLDTAIFIHTVGASSKSYRAGGEVHLYFGETAVAWGKENDTIQLINPSGVVVDTYSYGASSTWKTYKSPLGFEIQYPQNWGVVHEESLSGSENAKRWFSVAFGAGTYGNRGYDGEWFVFVYNKSISNVEELIKDMGKQFSDRKEKRENITINGVPAVKATVTAPSVPNWMYEKVILTSGNRIYVISNGAVTTTNSFATFYSSFKLLNPSGMTGDKNSSAQITASSLVPWSISSDTDKIISGTAPNRTSVGVYVVMSGKVADEWHTAYANDNVPVTVGNWSITVPAKKLNCNSYDVFVYGDNKALLAKGTFVGTGCDTNPNH